MYFCNCIPPSPPPSQYLVGYNKLDIITGNFRALNVTRAGTLWASVNDARRHYILLYILNYINQYYKYRLFRYVNGERKVK